MPYLSDEQITEVELQMADLLDQLAEAKVLESALRLALSRANADKSMDADVALSV